MKNGDTMEELKFSLMHKDIPVCALLQDMAIARKAIADSLLDVTVSCKNLICEVYCLTSFSDQTFYVQVYDDKEYILLFAKPFLHTPHSAK